MKLFFLSDIHGSLTYAQAGLEAFAREQAAHLILLGDVMYHGPRNALPDGIVIRPYMYIPQKINHKC
nr:hypothetical protein [Brevibacillus laterosporus]